MGNGWIHCGNTKNVPRLTWSRGTPFEQPSPEVLLRIEPYAMGYGSATMNITQLRNLAHNGRCPDGSGFPA